MFDCLLFISTGFQTVSISFTRLFNNPLIQCFKNTLYYIYYNIVCVYCIIYILYRLYIMYRIYVLYRIFIKYPFIISNFYFIDSVLMLKLSILSGAQNLGSNISTPKPGKYTQVPDSNISDQYCNYGGIFSVDLSILY